MTRSELVVWVAGFFDGEGCVYITKRRQNTGAGMHYELGANIAQKDINPLLIVHALWGGVVRAKSNQYGGIYHWHLREHKKLGTFLRDIRPYTLVKGSQIDVALEWLALYQRQVPALREGLKVKLGALRVVGQIEKLGG